MCSLRLPLAETSNVSRTHTQTCGRGGWKSGHTVEGRVALVLGGEDMGRGVQLVHQRVRGLKCGMHDLEGIHCLLHH